MPGNRNNETSSLYIDLMSEILWDEKVDFFVEFSFVFLKNNKLNDYIMKQTKRW